MSVPLIRTARPLRGVAVTASPALSSGGSGNSGRQRTTVAAASLPRPALAHTRHATFCRPLSGATAAALRPQTRSNERDSTLHPPTARPAAVPTVAAAREGTVPLAYRRSLVGGEGAAPIRQGEGGIYLPTAASSTSSSSSSWEQLVAQACPPSSSSSSAGPLVLPVLLLHCLLGDSLQFRLLEGHVHKAVQQLNRDSMNSKGSSPPRPLLLDCWSVDLRNHGSSPHTHTHSYTDIVEDIREFVRTHGIHRPLLMGHSMGGKSALAYALSTATDPTDVFCSPLSPRGLILFDAAPAAYTHQHSEIFAAMSHLGLPVREQQEEAAAASATSSSSPPPAWRTKREANEALKSVLSSPTDRAFVLSNILEQAPSSPSQPSSSPSSLSAPLVWRVNFPVLQRDEPHVHGWPLPPPPARSLSEVGPSYSGPALFIGGGLSSRLTTQEYTQDIPSYFPHHQVHMVPTAHHFVHQSHGKQCAEWVAEWIREQRGEWEQLEQQRL